MHGGSQTTVTMIGHYVVRFLDHVLGFSGKINWCVIFAHGLITHYTTLAEPWHHRCFSCI